MSQANVDVFLRSAEAVSRNDVEGVLATMDPEVEFIPQRAPVQGAYRGHADLRRFLEDNEETFEVFEWRPLEVRDLGDRVLGIGALHIRGKGSGVDTEVPSAVVATFKAGLVVHFKDHVERAAAFEAVGLSQ